MWMVLSSVLMMSSSAHRKPIEMYTEIGVIPIQAHRGGGIALPENTLETFEMTWKNRMIPEADIRTTSDHVIVCMHDAVIDRIAPGAPEKLKKVPFEELDLTTVKSLDVGAYRGMPGQKIPTLREVFEAMKGRRDRMVYLDYKRIDMDRLARLVKEYGLEKQVIFTTNHHDLIVQWKKQIPESPTMIWIGGSLDNIKQTMADLRETDFDGLTTLQIHVKLDERGEFIPGVSFLKEAMTEVERHGILFQVLPWRIDEAKVYEDLMEIGVRSFATDYMDMTLEVYKRFMEER